jgi:Reverse transcriptase (RNA-dependent DNA polymerase)
MLDWKYRSLIDKILRRTPTNVDQWETNNICTPSLYCDCWEFSRCQRTYPPSHQFFQLPDYATQTRLCKSIRHAQLVFCRWLTTRGFPEKYVTWVLQIFATSSSSILINGELTASFQHCWGLRQGDPISPFLFIVMVDVLQQMIKEANSSIKLSIIYPQELKSLF